MLKIFLKLLPFLLWTNMLFAQSAYNKINVLIVDGFSNHDWKQTSFLVKTILEKCGLFNVAISTAPSNSDDKEWKNWRPKFADYDVVIQNFNNIFHEEIRWPREVEKSLEDYVRSGGGLYILHSANNSFAKWEEYNLMIGLGWRSKEEGIALQVADNGEIVKIPAGEGEATFHGVRSDQIIHILNNHSINKGFPKAWKTPNMELYKFARGPAKNLTVLSYAKDDETKINWPVEWVVNYGKGRVYNSSMGHLWEGDIYPTGYRCVGFQTTLIRATEWLATGKTTYKVPENFPTQDKVELVKLDKILDAQEITSPNGKIKVILKMTKTRNDQFVGQAEFRVLYKMRSDYIEALPNSALGIVRSDQQFVDDLSLVKTSKAITVHNKYQMLHGKRKMCENFGTERVFSFQNTNSQPLDIVFRVYNDGVAFRYVFPEHSDSLINVTAEETTFVLPDSTRRWMQPYSTAYEDFFPFSKTGVGEKKEQEWGLPALFKVNNQPVWVLISEANLSENNCATKLCNIDNANHYKVTYPAARDNFPQTGVKSSLPWRSQWHALIMGKLSDIVESTLISDVSEPNQLQDTDWIKPGPVSWIYWANNHGSRDYQKVIEYVDLAVEMGWPYVLIDWEWDVMGNGGNIENAVKYANSKSIKPLMWYNSGTSWLDPTPNDRMLNAEKRTQEFTWLNKIGVYGIKVDFFAGDQQDMMQFYLDILKDAAKYHLMVNFHGATVPRGWSRTYPNLMTMEAVYGAEWYNNQPILTNKAAAHNTTLPYTRNVIGPMDYTPVTFSNSQHPHITSYGHELALSVVFESGLQHFADRPSAYHALPAKPKEFLQHVPVNWDETKLLDGYPGEKVIIARRKGSQWYIGGLNGQDEAQALDINFDFLGEGTYSFQLIKDGDTDTTFSIDSIEVEKGDCLKIECLPRGGFVGIISH